MSSALQYPSAEEYFKKFSWWERFRITFLMEPIGARLETRDGWDGFLLFYVFKCSGCGKIVKDNLHGFEPKQHLDCPECRTEHRFIPAEED